jgi:hypothetical protein
MSLVTDLFPNVMFDKTHYGALEDAIREQTDEQGLIFHEPWVLKLIQVCWKLILFVCFKFYGVVNWKRNNSIFAT